VRARLPGFRDLTLRSPTILGNLAGSAGFPPAVTPMAYDELEL
jgi:hypothetical protein